MAKGGGTEVTQQQSVSQQTTVSVQNVIESPGLEPLERLNLLADIFSKIDAGTKESQTAPTTVLSVQNVSGLALLKDPVILSVIIGFAGLLIYLKKR